VTALSFRSIKSQLPLLALLLFAAVSVTAQPQAKPKAPPAPPARPAAPADAPRPAPPPPQIVTVLHRLSGIKLMRWLHRTGAPVAAVVELENESASDADMHVSITAGFTVGDGQNIVASLPRAEAEAEISAAGHKLPEASAQSAAQSDIAQPSQAADMTVVRPDGSQWTALYVGLDGLTGLSLLRIDGQKLPSMPDASEEKLTIGQRVRLYAPEPAGKADARPASNLYLRIGEIEGRLTAITRSPLGRITHLTVRASNLSPSINGAIAINDAGETVGIVETSSTSEARILPAQLARRAAERVLARRSSVPRPVLGVRGRAVTTASLVQFTMGGWSQAEAIALMGKGKGLLLTTVVPNTPAAWADLRPGDIILSVNNSEIKSAEDFSYVLSESGGDNLLFTVLRGEKIKPFGPSTMQPFPAFDSSIINSIPTMPPIPPIKLKPFKLSSLHKPLVPIAVPVNFDFFFKPSSSSDFQYFFAPQARKPGHADPFARRGMETIPLAETAAESRGARAGVLVISVAPSSEASVAGLREGDVIETVNGRLLAQPSRTDASFAPDTSLSLGIVRRGQRLTVTLPAKEKKR
jgi:S1-C subfamily serine protease